MPKAKKKPSSVVQCNLGLTPDIAERIDAIVTERKRTNPNESRSQVARELLLRGLAEHEAS